MGKVESELLYVHSGLKKVSKYFFMADDVFYDVGLPTQDTRDELAWLLDELTVKRVQLNRSDRALLYCAVNALTPEVGFSYLLKVVEGPWDDRQGRRNRGVLKQTCTGLKVFEGRAFIDPEGCLDLISGGSRKEKPDSGRRERDACYCDPRTLIWPIKASTEETRRRFEEAVCGANDRSFCPDSFRCVSSGQWALLFRALNAETREGFLGYMALLSQTFVGTRKRHKYLDMLNDAFAGHKDQKFLLDDWTARLRAHGG